MFDPRRARQFIPPTFPAVPLASRLHPPGPRRRPSKTRLTRLGSVLLLAGLLGQPPASALDDTDLAELRSRAVTDCAPAAADYTVISWLGGWLDGAPRDPSWLGLQTGHYGLVVDPFRPDIVRFGAARSKGARLPAAPTPEPGTRWANRSGTLETPPSLPVHTLPAESVGSAFGFGRIRPPRDYARAAAPEIERDEPDPLLELPSASLDLIVEQGGREYRCVRAATETKNPLEFPVRIIESGRYLQRFDILQLAFETTEGNRLPAEGRLEVVAWPDRLALLLEVGSPLDSTDAASSPPTVRLRFAADRMPVVESTPISPRKGTNGISIASAWLEIPVLQGGSAKDVRPSQARTDHGPGSGTTGATVTAHDASTGDTLEVEHDAVRGWHRVELPGRSWSVAQEPDRLDRFRFVLTNDGPSERVVRLLFDDPSGTPSITGLTPMLRQPEGVPTGIPVQTSKNWHRQEDRRLLYEGPWLHAFTLLRLPPASRTEAEFTLAYARWGGVPAASHAQLSLVGWGWNQVWDQAAIGSWGESICYEPDAIQMRCRIDDVRPLMVWGMGPGKRTWTWTHNVGGGDFLVYYDAHGTYQPWTRVRTGYLSQGPNLTEVTYSGVTADGAIACQVRVCTPRTDDLHRAYHRVRYDVLKPVTFSRLAFYQVGSDRYHWHQYRRLARGNADGFLEEWEPGQGGRRYLRVGIPCPGDSPWFSMHQAIPADHRKPVEGAWAARGLVVRSWKARLGGRASPPFASVFGTEAGNIPSANLELAPPPELTRLEPGDFVEADLELLILPLSAEDYYGPNTNLKASLATDGNTWRAVLRQARGGRLELEPIRGDLLERHPPLMSMNSRQRAVLTVTGGLGQVPVSFAGLTSPDGWVLKMNSGQGYQTVDQSVHGNDFWQARHDPATGTWRLTFNLPLDSTKDARTTRRIWLEGRRAAR